MRKLNNSELKRISIEDFKKTKKNPIVIILDNVRSAHNVGSVFRTCDAFLVEKIYLCGITAKPPSNDIRKSALGSTKSVSWSYVKETIKVIKKLKKEDYQIVAVEQTENSTFLNDFFTKKKYKLEDISQIYVNRGPGSFAGIRNSLSVVKALSLTKNIDYFGFSFNDFVDEKNIKYENIPKLCNKFNIKKNLIKPIYIS